MPPPRHRDDHERVSHQIIRGRWLRQHRWALLATAWSAAYLAAAIRCLGIDRWRLGPTGRASKGVSVETLGAVRLSS